MFQNKRRIIAAILSVVLLLAAAIWIAYYFISQPPASEESLTSRRPRREVEITDSQPNVGEIFTIKVSPPAAETGKEVKVVVDGKEAGSCAAGSDACEITVGPFVRRDVGEHSYAVYYGSREESIAGDTGSFKVTDSSSGGAQASQTAPPVTVVENSGQAPATGPTPAKPSGPGETVKNNQTQNTQTPGGEATPADLPLPQYEKLVTSGMQVYPGDLFSAILYAKNTVPISKIDVYWNGSFVKSCEGTLVCNVVFGPATDAQIGTKINFNFVLVAVNGKTVSVGSYYFVVAKPASQPPTQPSTPQIQPPSDQTISESKTPLVPKPPAKPETEPAVSIKASKNYIYSDETVEFTATVDPGSKIVDYLNIAVNFNAVKTCDNIPNCSFTGGPYPDYAGKTVNYGLFAYFTDGTSKFTGYTGLSVYPAKTISVLALKDVVVVGETNTITATTNYSAGWTEHIRIIMNGEVVKSCNGASISTCSVSVGPFPDKGGSYINYYADWGSVSNPLANVKSQTKKFYIKPYAAPTVSVSLSPEKRGNYTYNENLTFTATANPGDETLDNLYVIINGQTVKTCHTGVATCSFTTTPYDILGLVPVQETNISYQGKGVFSNSSKTVSTHTGYFTVSAATPL